MRNARRDLRKLDTIHADNSIDAENIAKEKRTIPGVIVRISRYRIGPRSERWYKWQVHIYLKKGAAV